jgi:hypothetical protein
MEDVLRVVLRLLVGAVIGGAILAGPSATGAAASTEGRSGSASASSVVLPAGSSSIGDGAGAFTPARPAPQTTDRGGVQIVVDSPAPGSRVGGPVVLSGWAADPTSASGTGVARVAVYGDGAADAGGTYLGEARYGLARPDVARNLGAGRFQASGFALPLALPPGPHTLYVYAQPSGGTEGAWSEPTVLALDAGPQAPRVVAQSPEPALPPAHCIGVPAPVGVYGIETPQSYGAVYPFDGPFVFGNPRFWLTYGSPGAPAYIDFAENTVYTNSYFYQPRPARGLPLAC